MKCKLSLLSRLKVCWYVLTNKDFYCAITTDYYDNRKPLETLTLSNLPYTETAIKKLQKALKTELEILNTKMEE